MAGFASRFQNDILEVCHGVVEVSDFEGAVGSAILVAVFGREFGRAARTLSEVGEHFLVAPSGIPLTRPTVEIPSIPYDVYHPVDVRTPANALTFRPFAPFVSHAQADTLLRLDLSEKELIKIL